MANPSEIEEARALLVEEKVAWEKFLSDPQWKKLVYILKSQILTRQQESVAAAQSGTMDGNAKSLMCTHEVQGLKLALAMPGLLIDNIKTELQQIDQQDEENDHAE